MHLAKRIDFPSSILMVIFSIIPGHFVNCDKTVNVSSTGPANHMQSYSMGIYRRSGHHNGYPLFQKAHPVITEGPVKHMRYLYVDDDQNWAISSNVHTSSVNLYSTSQRRSISLGECDDNCGFGSTWKYYTSEGFKIDRSLRLRLCGEETGCEQQTDVQGTDAPITSYSRHRYMEYTPGTTNLIISVPHDGFLQPASIPDRVDGCRDSLGGLCHFPWTPDCPSKGPGTDEWYCRATTYSDTFTQEMGRGLVEEFTRLTGTRPYLVVNNLHRSKMDPNRDINRAAHGKKDAEDAYNDFHQFIEQAEAALGGPGLLIDLHGHTHPHEKVEIGYNYQPKDINNGDFTKDVSSMNALMIRTSMSPAELLAGDYSLGAMFEKEGYKTIPSPRQPVPGSDKYFRGGYTTRQHGSKDSGVVDALQIEVPVGIREGPQRGKDDFTKSLAKVIAEFHKHHYSV